MRYIPKKLLVSGSLLFLHMVMTTCSLLNKQCSVESPASIKFSIISRRNQTGHWTTQVSLHHNDELKEVGDQDDGPWEIDVEQISQSCDKSETVIVTATLTGPPERAGPDYEYVPGLGYYKLHTSPKTWEEARKTCVQERAHLAIVNSEKELKVLQGIFQKYPNIRDNWQNNYAHVGFHDLFTDGEYITIFGEPLANTGYATFAAGQPTDVKGTTGEDCGCVPRTGELHDVWCHEKLAFFCEQEWF